ncbi:MAG: caspase family protein [Gallionella sp.]|nr:caspase family protein [Gallionella sp.]
MKNTTKSTQLFRLKAAVVAVAMCFVSSVASANPTGVTVVNGSASMVTQGNTLSITNTPGTILNWQQFNINQGQTTQFIQQSAQSTVLNRVTGNNPSQILGTLRSNGQVFLINPFGIMFGVGSVVDVNGLIASTLNISNADFLLNRLNFSGSNSTSVMNQGTITTPLGGRVYLIGNNVSNQGVITTPQGQVVLAAGNQVSLVDSINPHISVTVNAPAGGEVVNLGTITAQGGSIDIYAPLIQQQGVIRADSASIDAQGNIVLSATQAVNLTNNSVTSANGVMGGSVTVQSGLTGSTTIAGHISATGTAQGGNVHILGKQVSLIPSASVDVSGSTGGGTVLVGGDFQGKNAAVQNAFSTSVAQGAVIKADALVNGHGGKSVVWANDTTTFAGRISARGGAQGGNGGNVEVSGKRILAFTGSVNTLAPKGTAGSLLLDPTSLCITDVAVGWAGCPSVLSPFTIATNALTNGIWTILTSATSYGVGDLIVVDPLLLTPATGTTNLGKTLILEANGGNVLTLTPAEALILKQGSAAKTATAALGGLMFTYGANLILRATGSAALGTGSVHVNNSILTDGGSFTIDAQGVASISGGGAFVLPGATIPNLAGIYTFGGAVNVTATDFVLGWDQRTGMTLATPVSINTMSGAVTTGQVLGGAVNIGTPMAGTPVMNSILLETGSAIYTGSGGINLSGTRFVNPNGTTSGAFINSTGHAGFNFDQIDTSRLSVHVDSLMFTPFSANKNVYLGLIGSDPRCAIDLCLFSNNLAAGNHYLWAGNGLGVASLGNMTVAGNVNLDGGNNLYVFAAANDITLNGVLSVTQPGVTLLDPVTGLPLPFSVTNLALIAGNRILNNVGAGALSVPAGHSWSLFAKDQTTSSLNGLSATSVVNMAQNPSVFSFASVLPRLTTVGDPIYLLATTAGNREVFWGSSTPTPTPTPTATPTPVIKAQTTELVDCSINPTICGSNVTNNAINTTNTKSTSTAIVKPAAAVGVVSYSPSLGVQENTVWGAYADIRHSRQEARQADEDLERTAMRLSDANNAEERKTLIHEVDTRSAWTRVKRAESRLQETAMELQAAETELKQAESPEARMRAEIRQTVAASRRAAADVKMAEAEVMQAEIAGRNAKTPEERALAEVKKGEAEIRKVQFEIIKAEVEVEKANIEVRQAEEEVARNPTPQAKANVEIKRAEAEASKADVAIKRADVEVKTAQNPVVRANAVLKVSVAEARKAEADAQKANVEAKQADEDAKAVHSPAVKRLAEIKNAEAEVKQAYAEVKKAEIDVNTAKDPVERANAEEKVARAEVKKADAEIKVAEGRAKVQDTEIAKAEVAVKKATAEEKRAEVLVKTEKESGKKVEAEIKLAEAQMKTVEAEAKQATEEVKEAQKSVKSAHSADDKYVALKKVEASEARVVAKESEHLAKAAEIAVKRVEAEIQQVESEVKEARSPEQRAGATKRLSEKQEELASKRSDAEQKSHHAAVLSGEANQKEDEHLAESARRDEKTLATFAGIDVTTMSPARIQELMSVRHAFLKGKLDSALQVLAANAKAADLQPCGAANGDVCIQPFASFDKFVTEVVARVRLPFMTPTSSFLPEIERKIAVVIGNNAYQDPDIPSLNGAVRDADAISKILKEKMGYDVRLIHNGTRADIVRTLNQVADETGSKDSVVVYYAGHGYQMEDTGMGYWIPSDGSTSSPANWISNADINKMLSSIPAKQMLIVSDSCFSGSLTNEGKVSSELTSKESPAEILGKRSVVVMSSGGEEPVMDEGRDGHSIFTWHLMDKLNKLGSYEHGAEVYDQIKAGVMQDGIPQIPQYGASVSAGHNVGGEYLFELRQY